MKKYFVLTLVLMMLISKVFAITIPTSTTMLQASLQIMPQIIYPGNDGYIQLTLKNVGTSTIESIKINQINFDAPIKLYSTSSDLGSLNAGDLSNYYIKFTVNKDASPGIYLIQFSIDYCQDSTCNTIYPNAIIVVQSPQTLEINKLYPSSVRAGDKVNLTFEISNKADSSVNNVIFTWNLPTNYSIFVTPLGAGNRIVIQEIPAKSTYDITVPIYISPSINPGPLPIIASLQYVDKSGSLQTITTSLGIEVTAETDFDVSIQDFSSNSISMVITNVGATEGYSVIIRLLPSSVLIPIGSSSAVLGNLAPGDYSTVNFQVSLIERNDTNTTNISRNISRTREFNRTFGFINVEISYTDSSGIRRTIVKSLQPNFISATGISGISTTSRTQNQTQFFNISSPGMTYVFIGIVGIIAITLFFRFALKRGKKR